MKKNVIILEVLAVPRRAARARPPPGGSTGARAKAWCFLIHAEATLTHSLNGDWLICCTSTSELETCELASSIPEISEKGPFLQNRGPVRRGFNFPGNRWTTAAAAMYLIYDPSITPAPLRFTTAHCSQSGGGRHILRCPCLVVRYTSAFFVHTPQGKQQVPFEGFRKSASTTPFSSRGMLCHAGAEPGAAEASTVTPVFAGNNKRDADDEMCALSPHPTAPVLPGRQFTYTCFPPISCLLA
jgi:hypothetical protein